MSRKIKFIFIVLICAVFCTAAFINAQDIEYDFSEEIETDAADEEDYALPEVEIVDTAPPATTTFTGEEAVEHNELSLDESLKRAAGIYIDQAPKGHSRISMRGYDMDMIGFYIDGIPFNDLYNKNIDISQIPVFSYSDINIQRGAASAAYGSDASVGVIELNSGIPEEANLNIGIILDCSGSDFFNGFYSEGDVFNTGLSGWLLSEDILEDFYYRIGLSVQDDGGYDTSAALTAEVKKQWLDAVLNPEAYGSSLSSFLLGNGSMLRYAAYDDQWNDIYSQGVNATAKAGFFIGDNAEAGVSAAFNLNNKKSLSYKCGYLSTWDEESESWITGSHPETEGFTERDYEWPYKYTWYVTPYYEQQLDSVLLKANLYYLQMADSVIWSGSYSNWFETTIGGRGSAEIDISDTNILTAVLLFRNDNHLESESKYTELPPTPLSDYLGGVRPPDEDVPDTVTVKELAGSQASLALEDEMDFDFMKITAGCSYDLQYFYKSSGEAGYWRQSDDGSWYYELRENAISGSTALLLGTRDSFNPALKIEMPVIPEVLTLDLSGSMKTRFPTFDNYYSDYYVMGEEVFQQELKNQVSYNANLGIEYIILPENLSVRVDGFYTSYTNKIEDYINSTGDTVYFNIPESISYGMEALCFFDFDMGDFIKTSGNLGYTLNIGTKLTRADSAFEYNPVHEVIFDTKTELLFELPTSIIIWGKYSTGAVAYRMTSVPSSGAVYPGEYLEAVLLNSPFYLHCKVIQQLPWSFSVFVTAENILDAYSIDPFNPGPGRTFSIGIEFDD